MAHLARNNGYFFYDTIASKLHLYVTSSYGLLDVRVRLVILVSARLSAAFGNTSATATKQPCNS